MDLTILFSPLPDSLCQATYANNSFYKSIKVYHEKMPDLKGAQVALLGVKEERGTNNNVGTSKGPDEIRQKLYHLKKGTGNYRIIDLGN